MEFLEVSVGLPRWTTDIVYKAIQWGDDHHVKQTHSAVMQSWTVND